MNDTDIQREIIIIDNFPPETIAMLQALYSRSPKSVKEHIAKLKEGGAERFMETFYVGYGHKSIGDCGTTSIFIENLSMLAAKAIQDTPLYNGQEASTRYLDMSIQPVMNPCQWNPDIMKAGEEIQSEWIKMYGEVLNDLIPYLKDRFPKLDSEGEKTYDKAIRAKAFDIARGFLSAGSTTYVAWHTNLRQAADHLKWLRHSPLTEVRYMADHIWQELQTKYPASFGHKRYPEEEEYIKSCQQSLAYFDLVGIPDFVYQPNLKGLSLSDFTDVLKTRPAKAELPKRLRECGDIDFWFGLDFGSFRDLQRQRNAVVAMPLLSVNHGFFPWYLGQLPNELREKMLRRLEDQEKRITSLPCNKYVKQYYVAMGYTVACKVTASLPSAVYIAELRSGQTVHPTLRVIAQKMARVIKETVPEIALHADMGPDEWTIKRGSHDIVKKS